MNPAGSRSVGDGAPAAGLNVKGAVLVVDDSSDMRVLLENLLATDGHEVRLSSSGEEALAAVLAQPPDLILLDIRLPGLDGFEVCRRLKAQPSSRDIPIIFITVVDESAQKVNALELGAADYITKPIQGDEVRARVHTQLALRRLRLLAEERNREGSRILLETAMDGFWVTDLEGRFLEVNQAYCRMSGYSEQEMLSMRIADIEAAETAAETAAHIDRVVSGGQDRFQSRHRRKDGTVFDVEISTQPRFGESSRLVAFVRDITDRELAQAAIIKTKRQYDELVSTIPVGVYILRSRPQGAFSLDFVSSRMAAMLGLEAESLREDASLVYQAIHPEDRDGFVRLNEDGITSLQPFDWEGRVLVDGRIKWLQISSTPRRLEDGDVVWDGVVVDITARTQAALSLRASLRDKEALLKEVHHRVKNNLQVINSLLRLETSRSQVADTKRVLKDMQGRIMSMALLHETLYRSERFGQVDLGHYLEQLAQHLFRAGSSSGLVRLELNLSPVHVGIDQAIPCGLIVNELLTNSLKHAFAEGQAGAVRIGLRQDADGRVELRVIDTGVGLPGDFEARRGTSLGLQLVADLARQLGGRLEIGPGPGAGFTVGFAAAGPHNADPVLRPAREP